MIYVECTYLDAAYQMVGSINKEFDSQGEFNAWYRVQKHDPYCAISVSLTFNPKDNMGLKQVYDSQLFHANKVYPV